MITATNVSKRFDSILAVDCVSTVISQGAVFGLIGSNGAGKSTFLRLLAGVLKPDQGEISVGRAARLRISRHQAALLFHQRRAVFLPKCHARDHEGLLQNHLSPL